MFRTIVGIALLGTTVLPVQAATHYAVHMTAASGTLTFYDPIQGVTVPSTAWTNSQNPNANLVGGYVSLGEVSYFFGAPMIIYTGDGTTAPAGTIDTGTGGPVPSATLDTVANTIQVDLSAFTWFWNGILNFRQGNPDVVGTWDPLTGAYTVSWETPLALGYGFDGLIGQWTMTGVAVVPEPETYAQMLAALALIAPLLRRRRLF